MRTFWKDFTINKDLISLKNIWFFGQILKVVLIQTFSKKTCMLSDFIGSNPYIRHLQLRLAMLSNWVESSSFPPCSKWRWKFYSECYYSPRTTALWNGLLRGCSPKHYISNFIKSRVNRFSSIFILIISASYDILFCFYLTWYLQIQF